MNPKLEKKITGVQTAVIASADGVQLARQYP
jgi:predicted regulator of Ras-like GTPase activity (Roadblock/LC7/MglB family)